MSTLSTIPLRRGLPLLALIALALARAVQHVVDAPRAGNRRPSEFHDRSSTTDKSPIITSGTTIA